MYKEITDALSRIAAGTLFGATRTVIAGYNAAPTTTFETVWQNSTLYAFLTANMASPTVVSSSANDTAAGTGARTVTVTGVDSAYALKTETVILNGATPVSLVNNYMSINTLVVATAGSGGVTAGNITLAAGGVTHAFITAGFNAARSYIYTVPANYGLLMYDLSVNEEAASAGGSRIQLEISVNGAVKQQLFVMGMPTNGQLDKTFVVPRYFAEKTQLQLQFLSAAATSVVTANSDCVLLNRTANQNVETWI